LETLCLY